jgi:diguanylate cyclase (GGDEF)-like protein
MRSRIAALQHLLASELPLDRVGPQLRDAAVRALRSQDEQRMLQTARSAASELLRRGELLRVAVEAESGDEGDAAGPFCLLRGTNRLIDLSAIGGESIALQLPRRAAGPAQAKPAANGFSDLTEMLVVMEEAQDLDLGTPQSGDAGVILTGVLRLLSRFIPQFRLFVQVGEGVEVPEDQNLVFAADRGQLRDGWQAARPSGHSVWIPSLDEAPSQVRRVLEADEPGFSCAAGVPLWEPPPAGEAKRREFGLLYVVAGEDWSRDATLRLAEKLARFVSRRWQHQRDVNQRIHRDGLTGAFNRAYFDSQFPLELERARRSQVPLSLVIVDIDHFKAINDTHGHQAGDRVLMMLVRRLHEELRRIDHVCRLGGEEFGLILPDTSAEAAHDVVTRLLNASYTETTVSGRESTRIAITLSFGAVTFPEAGADPFELYRKADAMLYLSKDLGRKQCHFWSSQGDHFRLLPGSDAV